MFNACQSLRKFEFKVEQARNHRDSYSYPDPVILGTCLQFHISAEQN